MTRRQHIFPAGKQPKGGNTYGARVTLKAARRGGIKTSSASLNHKQPVTHNSPNADLKPRSGLSPKRIRQLNAAAMRYYWKRKAEFAARNLTTRGTARIYELHRLAAHGQHRRNLRSKIYTARLNAAGLSKRGNKKCGLVLLTPLESQYRMLRSLIQIPPVSFEDAVMLRNEGIYTNGRRTFQRRRSAAHLTT